MMQRKCLIFIALYHLTIPTMQMKNITALLKGCKNTEFLHREGSSHEGKCYAKIIQYCRSSRLYASIKEVNDKQVCL
jgi:hypothetical protein